MSVRNKIVGLAVAAMSLGAMQAHAQKAPSTNKTKAQTVNVVNQSKEYWLNSTDGDRMLVIRNKQGGVDIQTTDGLGWSVSRTGKVSALGDLGCTPEDAKIANTIAYAITGNTIHKDKGYKQEDGESILHNIDGFKFFANSHINEKTGKKENIAYVIGDGPELFAPRPNELSWEQAQQYSSIEEENKKVLELFTALCSELPEVKQTADDMAVISKQPKKQSASQDIAFSAQKELDM